MTDRLRTIALCARQEMLVAARSRWTYVFASAFAVLAIAVAASGYILSGGYGVQDFGRTAASLLQLVLLIVPLTALVMGVIALTPDRGAAELLFSQPVARSDVMVGTVLGLFEALVAAQAIGFGAAGMVIFLNAGTDRLPGFITVIGASIALTAIFLSLAAALSVGHLGRRRVRALASALVLWLVFVLLLDVITLAVATTLRSGHASRLLIVSVLVNPASAVRTATLLIIEGTAAFGAGSLALLRFTGGVVPAGVLIAGSLLLWIVAPLFVAARRLRRIDIA